MSFFSRLVRGGVQYRQGFPVLPGAVPLLGHAPLLFFGALEALRRGHAELGPAFCVTVGPGVTHLFCMGPEGFELLKNRAVTVKGAFKGLDALVEQSMAI